MEDWRYRELYELEDRHWWFRGRRAVIWSLLRRSGVPHPARILDAGCGTGRNLVEFSTLGEAHGVDISDEAVLFCRERGLSGVRLGSLESLPFADDDFNLLLATDVIEHLDDDARVLRELRRVAAPGARLIVTVPAYQWLWSDHDVSMHHRRRYTAGRVRRQAVSAGWEPLLYSYFFAAVLLPVAALRLIRRLRPGSEVGSDLAVTPRALNRALEWPAQAEASLIERGVRLPAGVSIGMVLTTR